VTCDEFGPRSFSDSSICVRELTSASSASGSEISAAVHLSGLDDTTRQYGNRTLPLLGLSGILGASVQIFASLLSSQLALAQVTPLALQVTPATLA
jgi:hypothetical protein